MTGLVTVTVTKRLPLAGSFEEVERRADVVIQNLVADGFLVERALVSEIREADQVDGEVRA